MKRPVLVTLGVLAGGLLVWAAGRAGDPLAPLRDPTQPRQEIVRQMVADTPPAGWVGLVNRVATVPDGADLAWMAALAAEESDPEAAGPAVEAYLDRFPNTFRRGWWVRQLVRRGRFAEAQAQVTAEVARVGDDAVARRAAATGWLDELIRAGRASDAVSAADFRDLEHVLRDAGQRLSMRSGSGLTKADVGQLTAVLAAVTERGSRTPWADYWAGRLCEADGRHADAAVKYQACLAQLQPGDRDRRVVASAVGTAYANCGQWERGYEVGLPEEAFAEYLSWFRHARPEDVSRLITLHAGCRPADPLLRYATGWQHLRRGENEQAARACDDVLIAELKLRGWAVEAADVRFRALVRLGRWDEARAVVAGRPAGESDANWQPILWAEAGDVKKLTDWLAEDQGADRLRFLYADPDLGPRLRKLPAITDKFPPP